MKFGDLPADFFSKEPDRVAVERFPQFEKILTAKVWPATVLLPGNHYLTSEITYSVKGATGHVSICIPPSGGDPAFTAYLRKRAIFRTQPLGGYRLIPVADSERTHYFRSADDWPFKPSEMDGRKLKDEISPDGDSGRVGVIHSDHNEHGFYVEVLREGRVQSLDRNLILLLRANTGPDREDIPFLLADRASAFIRRDKPSAV